MGYDIPQAISTIKDAQVADAEENIFFIYAHDTTLRDVVEFFPASANDWKKKGWARETRWAFLSDLGHAVEKS